MEVELEADQEPKVDQELKPDQEPQPDQEPDSETKPEDQAPGTASPGAVILNPGAVPSSPSVIPSGPGAIPSSPEEQSEDGHSEPHSIPPTLRTDSATSGTQLLPREV